VGAKVRNKNGNHHHRLLRQKAAAHNKIR